MANQTDMGIRIAAQPSADATDSDLAFINQLGVRDVTLWASRENAGYDYYVKVKERFNAAGIEVYALGNSAVHCMDSFVLNLPDRAKKLEVYKQHIRDIGKAGIHYMTHSHIANGVWSSPNTTTRGGATTRALDLQGEKKGDSPNGFFYGPLSHGRAYGEDEIWDNYEYFIRQIAPVAEESNVYIGVHPDDPPVAELAGVPRCFFSFDSYKRALEIADSPNIGLCLCVGCWLEGGESMGKDIFETIKYFGEQKKLFKIHFRNVDRPLPHFVETFIDDGYMVMYRVVRALREVDYTGVIMPDHVPSMAGGEKVGMAFTIGYIKALIERANEEAAGSSTLKFT